MLVFSSWQQNIFIQLILLSGAGYVFFSRTIERQFLLQLIELQIFSIFPFYYLQLMQISHWKQNISIQLILLSGAGYVFFSQTIEQQFFPRLIESQIFSI